MRIALGVLLCAHAVAVLLIILSRQPAAPRSNQIIDRLLAFEATPLLSHIHYDARKTGRKQFWGNGRETVELHTFLASTHLSTRFCRDLLEVRTLQRLSLTEQRFDNGMLRRLSQLTNLEDLRLSNCEFAGELPDFGAMPRLRVLWVTGARLSADDLKALLAAPRLRELRLVYSDVTDADVAHIADAQPELEVLDLWYTGITQESLPELSRLVHLRELSVAGTAVTSLEDLDVLPELEILWASETGIDVSSVRHVLGFPRLKTLHLTGCPSLPDDVGEVVPVPARVRIFK
ncbi:leucine-rich repeat domain-containing protein [Maioricimonas rarisocia]|uniref:leucine-rich repeat domain-containing protein n=1 Tax=Maioricimonas rarisocia TaxID=2528026 RepID=UPI0011A8811E|nr:hypothetical protein [Maioricimonas rarisocia]